MPISSWDEWFIAGCTSFGVGLGALGVAFVEALDEWRPHLIVAGWAFLMLGLCFFAMSALQIRYAPFVLRLKERRRQRLTAGAIFPLPGFSVEENQLFREGDLHGVRIRIRPRGFTPEAAFRFSYDASLTMVRWRVEAHRGGRFHDIGMGWIEREAGNEAARAAEIAFDGPPPFTPDTDLVVQILGPNPVRVTNIERLA